MPEKTEPALSSEEWADIVSGKSGTAVFREGVYADALLPGSFARFGGGDDDGCIECTPETAALTIAIANAVLPDDSPRKITSAVLADIRAAAAAIRYDSGDGLRDSVEAAEDDATARRIEVFVAALESCLPPEGA